MVKAGLNVNVFHWKFDINIWKDCKEYKYNDKIFESLLLIQFKNKNIITKPENITVYI